MGLSIGQIPAGLAGARSASATQRAQSGASSGQRTAAPRFGRSDEANFALFDRNAGAQAQAGFQRPTTITSIPGAAINALGRGLDSARSITPSLQELQQEARARFREQREVTEGQVEARNADRRAERRVDVSFRQDFSQVSNPADFVNQLNDTAGRTLARINGNNEPQSSTRGASFRVNGQTFPIGDRFSATNAPAPTERTENLRIDVRA